MMQAWQVDLFELDQNRNQRKIATFEFAEDTYGTVHIIGEQTHPVIEAVMREGIFDYKYARPGRLYPYDGMTFLENLKYHFRSGYLVATDVHMVTVDR